MSASRSGLALGAPSGSEKVPDTFLPDTFLPRLTVTKGADVLGVSRKALSELVNGRSGISPEMAIRLAKAFGGSPDVWLRMQMNYTTSGTPRRAPTTSRSSVTSQPERHWHSLNLDARRWKGS